MLWSPQQEAALAAVSRWLREKSAPFFYLAGYAGTGKTTLATHLVKEAGGNVMFASFTGKAAAVMRSKGCTEATTIHRLIYSPCSKGSGRLKELREQLDKADNDPERIRLRREIHNEVDRLKRPHWLLNMESDLRYASLLVIDECSMVGTRMAEDLLSFKVPVLVLGDPAQLPPVMGGGYFTQRKPDHMLTEVHRQAQDSGILRLATLVREGRALLHGNYGDARVISPRQVDPKEVLAFDQILAGRRATVWQKNVRARELLGRTSQLPQAGDRLMCLRNNHDLGLLNGEVWNTLDAQELDQATVGLTIENGDLMQNVTAWAMPFRGEELGMFDHDRDTQEFTYGYAMTTHKAQGSQWARVYVFDESHVFRQDAAKHLYTAITRAADELVVVR